MSRFQIAALLQHIQAKVDVVAAKESALHAEVKEAVLNIPEPAEHVAVDQGSEVLEAPRQVQESCTQTEEEADVDTTFALRVSACSQLD